MTFSTPMFAVLRTPMWSVDDTRPAYGTRNGTVVPRLTRMPRRSAGIVLCRPGAHGVEVLIAHMGGPFWARRDARAWTIPKGEFEEGESPREVARREFREELGVEAPDELTPLGEFRQSSAKLIEAFMAVGDLDVSTVTSDRFEMEWPRGSGRIRSFPEIDRAEWVSPEVAREKLVRGQVPIVEAAHARLRQIGEGCSPGMSSGIDPP